MTASSPKVRSWLQRKATRLWSPCLRKFVSKRRDKEVLLVALRTSTDAIFKLLKPAPEDMTEVVLAVARRCSELRDDEILSYMMYGMFYKTWS